MALFYFDHSNKKPINDFFEGVCASRMYSVMDANECKKDDLIFVHLEVNRDKWCELSNRGIYVIFMSTDIHSLQQTGLNDYVHNCEYPANRLSEYPQIEKFIKKFSNSRQWDLLKKPLFPEALTAAYLLMITNEKFGVSLNFPHWEEACVQYKEIGGEKDADWRNASRWNLDEIGRVKGKIAVLLSKTPPANSMMLSPWNNLPCQASRLLGQLKHTYLKNKICLQTLPEDLLESMLYLDCDRLQHQIIQDMIHDLLKNIGSPEHGFSPAQLVDQLNPIRELPDSERRMIKERIHIQFSREFQLAKRCALLENISASFLAAMDAFLFEPNVGGNMEKVQDSARNLIRELEQLPKGIWLYEPANNTKNSS